MPEAKIGVIGGSGLYNMGLTDLKELDIDTPFGKPSDIITVGRLEGTPVAFLPRHGRGHRLLPTEVPYRANIYALKTLGVTQIIGVNSVGSFKSEIKPGDLLIPNQLIDRTRSRPSTFFGEGIVAHVSFAEPFCAAVSKNLFESAKTAGATVHNGGTYVVMEGPAFSTRAESKLYKSWGADVIGMTALPEAKLAREAEICYGIIACVTDYDCWQDRCEPVNVEIILEVLRKNIEMARSIIKLAIANAPDTHDCECASALKTAIVTSPGSMPRSTCEKLRLLIKKYLPEEK